MPAVTPASMIAWCKKLLGIGPGVPQLSLEEYLAAMPGLDKLADLPKGTAVLVRGDVDAKPGPTVGDGDIRLRSMVETLKYGQARGWKQIVLGHIGRKPEGSLNKVQKRLAELLGCEVPLVSDWLDDSTGKIKPELTEAVAKAAPGSVILLENTRKYGLETVLWKAKEKDLEGLAPRLATLCNELAGVAKVYVHEALSAGSLDSSSVVVPAGMDRVALGTYIAGQFHGPMLRCRNAELVVFSGLKTDKLDDLEAIVERGKVKMVITAGSLAMALLKADGKISGKEVSLGVAEDPAHADKPYYIEPARIDQARKILETGRKHGAEFVLPVDFVLADGKVAEKLAAGDQQFDVGPKSSEHFAAKVGEFIAKSKAQVAAGGKPAVAFHNGVFGMFEDARFEGGTKRFTSELKRMKDAGVEVYVGGGEGGAAVDKYGQPDWITHCFTAGGTVLNALGAQPIPYLQALYLAVKR
jgi:phosphoglycerate kinase